jgi:hypothetical protein
MKKIAQALGMANAEKATEAQIIEAIAKQKSELETVKNTVTVTAEKLAECEAHIAATKTHSDEQVKAIDELQAANDEKALAMQELANKLQDCETSNPNELTEEEAIAKATETLTEAGMEVGWPTSDGTVFTNQDEANAYANANRLKALEAIKIK